MLRIEEYFLIGDLHTAALVSRYGSIDWLCLPNFDSESVFARILDKHAGTFALDNQDLKITSVYIPNTAVVEHRAIRDSAEFLVRDFMLPQPVNVCKTHFLVRNIIGKQGLSQVRFFFSPRLEYGKLEAIIQQEESALCISLKGHMLMLHLPKDAIVISVDGGVEISFYIQKGEKKRIVLEYGIAEQSSYTGQDFEVETTEFWDKWVSEGHFFDFYRDKLIRSAITLKLMQFYPTGAIVAAPTTSIPETIGGERNWDYRYVWIRDATFTLYALYVLGYTEEAKKFFTYIEYIFEAHKKEGIQLMYTIWGEEVPPERILTHLEGYQYSRPVRVGNNAADQFQLDVYGSFIDAHYFMFQRGVTFSEKSREILVHMVRAIEKKWHIPDSGIWEIRFGQQHFTYSKAMAWVGVNRALLLADILGISSEEQDRFRALEQEIKDWIWTNCWEESSGILRQHPGTLHQDATNFLLVILKFLDKHDPRTQKIIANTARELVREDIFVNRYHTDDGLDGEEGAFVLCTFWYISALAIMKDTETAEKIFEAFSFYSNNSSLLPEEIDSRTGQFLGNYPQAFSHMGYIMSVYYLHKYRYSKL